MTKALFYFRFLDNNKKIKINFSSLRRRGGKIKRDSRRENNVLKNITIDIHE
jgi:hypothetical protein